MSYQYGPIVKLPFGEYSNRASSRYTSFEKALPPLSKPIHRGKTRSCIPHSNVYEDMPSTPYFRGSASQNGPVKVNWESFSERKPVKKTTSFSMGNGRFDPEDLTRGKDFMNQLKNFKLKLKREIIFHNSSSTTDRKKKQFSFEGPVRVRNFPWEVFSIPK